MKGARNVLMGVWLGLMMIPWLWFPAHAQQTESIPKALGQQDPKDEPEPAEDLEHGDADEMDTESWVYLAYDFLGATRVEFEQLMRRRVRNTLNLVERLAGISPDLRDKVTATAEHEVQRLDADIATLAAQSPKKILNDQEYSAFRQKFSKISAPYQEMLRGGTHASEKGPKALWEKVLLSNLTDEQKELFEKDQREKEKYRNKIDRLETLLQVSRVLGLSSQQLKEFEAIADANPEGWITLVTAWTTLTAMSEEQQRERFTESQRIRLTLPLEYFDPLDPFAREIP